MCTTTDTEIKDTNTTETNRDVSELLKLDTYQGMTDAEIESIITYKKALAVSSAFTENSERFIAECNKLDDDFKKQKDLLDSICANVIKFIPSYSTATLCDVNGGE